LRGKTCSEDVTQIDKLHKSEITWYENCFSSLFFRFCKDRYRPSPPSQKISK